MVLRRDARPLTLRFTILVACIAAIFEVATARAQHASDNPVVSAEDAFGLTLGLESIGMYSPGQVRGFSPLTAGNVRIDGLYFDQQGAPSNRVIEGWAIRVGVSEIGYDFPAPTGIVDYELRHPGDGTQAPRSLRTRARTRHAASASMAPCHWPARNSSCRSE